ncbi:hypothetical protein D3C81_1389230 [compost metagenome]
MPAIPQSATTIAGIAQFPFGINDVPAIAIAARNDPRKVLSSLRSELSCLNNP